MKETPLALAAVAGPSVGPAVVSLFGIDVPVLSATLSIAGLILARQIAPPPLRKLTKKQEWALTALLVIVDFLVVTGQFTAEPLGAGIAVLWGIGLGFSGLLVVEFFGQRVMAMLRVMFGGQGEPPAGTGGGNAPL